jgi:polyhydroxybutyrate depolymerase
MNVNAAAAGIYNIYPQGTTTNADGSKLGWNAGFSTCSTGKLVNDVDFARAVVLYSLENLCVEPASVYAAGFSNGGSMVFNLTCEMSDTFSAFSWTGANQPASTFPAACGAAFVRPTLGMCGSTDGCGSKVAGWFADYAAASHCTDRVNTTVISGATTCHSHHACEHAGAGEFHALEYCLTTGLGHCWSGNDCCDSSCSNQDPANIDASKHLLQFFDGVPKAAAVQLDAAQLAAQIRAQLNATKTTVNFLGLGLGKDVGSTLLG